MTTLTFYEMKRAVLALLAARVDTDCEFTTCLKHLLAQPNVPKYMKGNDYKAGKRPIDQAQCDHQSCCSSSSLTVLEKEPKIMLLVNIISNHITGKHYF